MLLSDTLRRVRHGSRSSTCRQRRSSSQAPKRFREREAPVIQPQASHHESTSHHYCAAGVHARRCASSDSLQLHRERSSTSERLTRESTTEQTVAHTSSRMNLEQQPRGFTGVGIQSGGRGRPHRRSVSAYNNGGIPRPEYRAWVVGARWYPWRCSRRWVKRRAGPSPSFRCAVAGRRRGGALAGRSSRVARGRSSGAAIGRSLRASPGGGRRGLRASEVRRGLPHREARRSRGWIPRRDGFLAWAARGAGQGPSKGGARWLAPPVVRAGCPDGDPRDLDQGEQLGPVGWLRPCGVEEGD